MLKKRINFREILMGGLIALVFTVAVGCSGSSKLADSFDEAEVKQSAEKMIQLVEEKDYQTFIENFDDSVKPSLTQETFDTGVIGSVEPKGKFESIEKETLVGQTDKETGKNYAGIIVTAKYTNGNIQFTMGYNEEMKLIQFLIK